MTRRANARWMAVLDLAEAFPRLILGVLVVAGPWQTVGCGASGAAKTDLQGEPETAGSGGSSGTEPIGAGGASTGGGSATSRRTTGGTTSHTSGGAANSGGTRAAGGAAGNGGTHATGGTSSSSSLNPPITGSQGFATRYWDCCKPSCSWTTGVPACQKDGTTHISDRNATSGCDGGGAYECYDFAPWYDAATNMSYGFAAYNASGCGACYQLQFTGESNNGSATGAAAIKGKQMIVQVINIGNIASGQFDLLIPGGGVGEKTAGCTAQWGSVDLGVTYGGLLSECSNDPACMAEKCQSVFGKIPTLLAGCNWFTGWFSSADNPKLVYKQVSCPSQITSKSGISG